MVLGSRMRDDDGARAVGGTVATMEERDGNAVDATRTVAATPADGDDIQVVPGGPGNPPPGARTRRILVGVALAAAIVVVLGIVLTARHRTGSTVVRTATPATLAALPAAEVKPGATAHPAKVGTITVAPTVPTTEPRALAPAPTAVVSSPVSHPVAPATTPATTLPAPRIYGASVLQWTTTPPSLTVVSGHRAALSVVAHNPTAGVVDLAHPLGCTPRLDHGEICAQMVQTIGPGQSAGAHFTIDATGVHAGSYTLVIEGVLTVRVTVS